MENTSANIPTGALITKGLWLLLRLLPLAGPDLFFSWHTEKATSSLTHSAIPPDTIKRA